MAAERGSKDYAAYAVLAQSGAGEHLAQGPPDGVRSAAQGALRGRRDGAQRTAG